ncbi:tetratricopeptide repeat protein [Providencia rettgeri]
MIKYFLFFLFIILTPFCDAQNISSSEIEKWTELANAENSDQAQYALGVSYFYGDGVDENRKKAIEWFEKSARQGNKDAQSFLGAIYYWGYKPISKDHSKAFFWNEKAANNNDVNGQLFLGLMYAQGFHVEKNYGKALYWLTKATENEYHSDAARYYLALMYANGNGVDKDYIKTRVLLEEIRNDIEGIYLLAQMYVDGIGGEINYEKARKLFEQVAVSEEREIIVPKSLIYLIFLMETNKIQPKFFSDTSIYAYLLLDYMLKPYPSINNLITK